MTGSLKLGLLLLPVVGCGPAYRTEVVAQTSLAAVEPTTSAAVQAALEIPPETADVNQETFQCVDRYFQCDAASGRATEESAQAQLDCLNDLGSPPP